MFEVIFIGSAATLTGILMKKKKPSGFVEWIGLILTILGFGVGIVFVLWSNINGMAPTWEGRIIGAVVPLLVLIGEGILAYRYLSETEKNDQTQLLEIIQRNGVSAEDALKAIKTYIANRNRKQPEQTERREHPEHEQPGNKQIKQSEHERIEQAERKQVEHEQSKHEHLKHEQFEREQIEHPEHKQIEQSGHEQIEQIERERIEREQIEHERSEHERIEHHEHEQSEHPEREQIEQTEQEQIEQVKQERIEQIEQDKIEQDKIEQDKIEQDKIEQDKIEQDKIEQAEHKQIEHKQRKTKLYVVKGGGKSKVDIAVQCALKLMEQGEEFSVRELAKIAGCSVSTAHTALTKLKKIAQ